VTLLRDRRFRLGSVVLVVCGMAMVEVGVPVAAGLGPRGPRGAGQQGRPGAGTAVVDEQLSRLKQRLGEGPAAAGYGDDQRWTQARVSR
jgi:hypothetical protein